MNDKLFIETMKAVTGFFANKDNNKCMSSFIFEDKLDKLYDKYGKDNKGKSNDTTLEIDISKIGKTKPKGLLKFLSNVLDEKYTDLKELREMRKDKLIKFVNTLSKIIDDITDFEGNNYKTKIIEQISGSIIHFNILNRQSERVAFTIKTKSKGNQILLDMWEVLGEGLNTKREYLIKARDITDLTNFESTLSYIQDLHSQW